MDDMRVGGECTAEIFRVLGFADWYVRVGIAKAVEAVVEVHVVIRGRGIEA